MVLGMSPVDCQCRAFQAAVEVLGRPWNAFLLTMLQGGPLRFSEISARPNGPGDKVLTARLKELEARGLIDRKVDAGPPIKVSYELTKQGRAFGDVSSAIEKWGRELRVPAKSAPAKSRRGDHARAGAGLRNTR
jgi:DNA-binding HxlR family transcriptional regulator